MLLIDAYSQIFRGFHAIADLTDSRGEPTNAIFALAKLLLKLEKEFPETRGAAVFDCGKVGFRLALNPAYKANRPPMPENLKKQMPEIRRLFELFGWPALSEPEYEADDLIGALARESAEPVRILSSDKDLSQLIDSRVTMLVPGFKGGLDVRDEAAVRTKFGVSPEQLIDYLALLGDASDNIPGVPGIGAKTAVSILNAVGGLEAFYAEPERLDNARQREKLLEFRAIAERNCALIRLKTDLPARFRDAGTLDKREPDWAGLAAFCREHDLHSILKNIEPHLPAQTSAETAEPELDFGGGTPDQPAAEPAPEAVKWVQGELF